MHETTPFAAAPSFKFARLTQYRGVRLAADYGDAAGEYERTRKHASIFDRSHRGLVTVRGKDRAAWLHNLTTNDIKKLKPGEGCYAFACDVRGRIQFDLNVLCFQDELWLDLDAFTIPAALAHFNRFLISEDVQLQDVTDRYARFGIAGPLSDQALEALGVADSPSLRLLNHVSVSAPRGSMELFLHDFAGVSGFEMVAPLSDAAELWKDCECDLRLACGLTALDALRIEAGIPWLGRDIDDKVTPPETGQIARAISYHKGCYLGQEVIERMRSHNVLPRRLVRLEMASGDGVSLPQPLKKDGLDVGRVTSLVQHPVESKWIGLGYLKSTVQPGDTVTTAGPPRPVTILPAGQ